MNMCRSNIANSALCDAAAKAKRWWKTNNWCDAVTDCHRDWFFNPILMIFGAASKKLGSKPFNFYIQTEAKWVWFLVFIFQYLFSPPLYLYLYLCLSHYKAGVCQRCKVDGSVIFPLPLRGNPRSPDNQIPHSQIGFWRGKRTVLLWQNNQHQVISNIAEKCNYEPTKNQQGTNMFFSWYLCCSCIIWFMIERRNQISKLRKGFWTIFYIYIYMCTRVFVYIYLYLCVSCTPCMFGRLCALLAGTWGG